MNKTYSPLISVIVTTYNRKNMLKDSILSILNQTYSNFELIVVDNFSDYDFFNYIKSFNDSRIKPFQSKNNGIIAVNRNFGINKSNGELIAFCDDDDYWHKSKLSNQILVFNDSNTILVSSLALSVGENVNFFSKNYGFLYSKVRLNYESFIKVNPIILSSVMIRKDAIEKVNGFSENINLIATEDYDLFLRLYDLGNFVLIKKLLVYYRFHPGSISKLEVGYKEKTNLKGIRKINETIVYNNLLRVLIKNCISLVLICKIRIVAFISDLLNSKRLIYINTIQK